MKSLSMAETDFFALLENNGPAGTKEWNELAALLTTGESCFFRDKEQFALLGNRIQPSKSHNK
jgi:chemotaxis protein methyltransferase CheR